jgi:hypothetical protein
MVGPAPDVGDLRPQHPLDGIVGSGYSANVTRAGNIGGVGVIGNGGANQGTGVLGRGGFPPGVGGIGVHGIGGSQSEPTWDPNDPPGIGVLAQGGRQNRFNQLRLLHAAAVVAIAGGLHDDLFNERKIPPLKETGSIGVYAQGADAEVGTTNINGVDKVVGPPFPGAGVLGQGGVPISHDGTLIDEIPPAAGVIGLAGGTPIPPISDTGNTGVYGRGPVGVIGQEYNGVRGKCDGGNGVYGETDSGAGICGEAATNGRGGQFRSKRSAQVRLVPQSLPMPTTDLVPPTAPTTFPEGFLREWAQLPQDGQGGDLLALQDLQRQCTLWFCVQGRGPNPARWAQVLLGPSFDGLV